MDMKKISEKFTVTPQIAVSDMAAIREAGFRAIICNRPDGEGADQPGFREIEAAARAEGIEIRYLPVQSGVVRDEDVTAFGDAMSEVQRPTLAYCRTGTRSATLWSLHEAKKRPISEILAMTKSAGYDMNGVVRRIVNGGRTPTDKGDASYDVVIVGGGAGGISVAASLKSRTPDLSIAVIDPADTHYYQPGWTMVGGGIFDAPDTAKTIGSLIPRGVKWIRSAVAAFEPQNNAVILDGCRVVKYGRLVVCPGLKLDWAGVEGLVETLGRNGVTSNYRYDLAPYTWELVQGMKQGRAIFTQPPMPIKCAGAPQKAMYLSGDAWFRRGVLNDIDIQFMNASGVLFGVKDYVPALMEYVEKYDASLNFFHNLVSVDGPARLATFRVAKPDSEPEKVTVDFDMIHVCPPQTAPDFIRVSPLADAAGWVNVDQATLRHKTFENIWSLGDVMNAPNAKTAAAARKQAPIVAENIVADIAGRSAEAQYDGYGSCPLTVERGKIVLAEFGYGGTLKPSFPKWLIDGTRPTRAAWLLKERILPPIYWKAMLRGREWMAKPEKVSVAAEQLCPPLPAFAILTGPNMLRYFPILDWGRHYTRTALANDLIAAVIVTIMLIPQSLAYALLAGLPPEAGIYASIAPIILYAVFGTSRALAVGPVAVVSLMTAAAVGEVAAQGTAGYAVAALTLAFLSGGFLLLLGVLRLGFIANFLSHPVIAGFIAASGILIATSQLKHILGVPASGHTLPEMLGALWMHLGETNLITLVIGLTATVFLFWVRKSLKAFLKRIGVPHLPADILTKAGPVLAVVATTLAVQLFELADRGVRIVGDVPQSLPPLTMPGLSPDLVGKLMVPAILISVIGFVESISVAQTLAAKKRQRIDPDQELIGLGAANLGAAFAGGYPVTGGFARSVVNFDAGAETPAAGAFTAIGLTIAAVALTPLVYFLPNATLAATIIVAVLGLVDLSILRKTWAYSRADFSAVVATIAVTLLVGVEAGVASGVLLSVMLHLYKTSRPHVAEVGLMPGTQHFRNINRHHVETDPALVTLRVDESLYFVNARFLEDLIQRRVTDGCTIRNVVLMFSAVNEVDYSALESLEAINRRLRDMGVGLHLSEVKGPVMDRLDRSHLTDTLNGRIFLSQFEAWESLKSSPSHLTAAQ